jgi:hypothetical protein
VGIPTDQPFGPSDLTFFSFPGSPNDDEESTLEPFPEWLKGLKASLEKVGYGAAPEDRLSKTFKAWVEKNWRGAAFTPGQLGAAFALVQTELKYTITKSVADDWVRANPPGTFNPYVFVGVKDDVVANLLGRALAIQQNLRDRPTSRVSAAKLEGALSALGLVLAIVYPSALKYIPDAGAFVGKGSSPAASLEAALTIAGELVQDSVPPVKAAPVKDPTVIILPGGKEVQP